jgi:hypothetical protein
VLSSFCCAKVGFVQFRGIRLGFQDRMFVLAHQCFLSFKLGFEISCIHASDNLPALHDIAFIKEKFEDGACEFCVDVDFLGIDTAVAPENACWNRG